MEKHTFKAVLVRPDMVGSWTYLVIPFSVEEAFGVKGQVKVKGTVNGYPYRSSAMPQGDGQHYLVVGKSIRDHIHATQGDTVQVTMELDTEARSVDVSDDFAAALDAHPTARDKFDKLSYSRQKEYVDWIESTKTEATRQRRIESGVEKIAAGEVLKK
jgi:hypothetical protein